MFMSMLLRQAEGRCRQEESGENRPTIIHLLCCAGMLSAVDHTGQEYEWGAHVADGELWVPTMAWTGAVPA
eukprot:COSAG06_NODE_13655_length_1234_cov_1.755947_2_plen_70_part_01